MRKGFQKLAAELLVEEVSADTIISISKDSQISRYKVKKKEDVEPLIKAIDDVSDTPDEIGESDPKTQEFLIKVRDWLKNEKLGLGEPEKVNLTKIIERNFLSDPSCLAKYFGSVQSFEETGSPVIIEHKLIADLAKFVPFSKRKSETTGEGEFALAFLAAKFPARASGYDLVVGNRQYTIKNNEQGVETFIYKFKNATKKKIAASKKIKRVSVKAAAILGLIDPSFIPAADEPSELAEDQLWPNERWAIVCKTENNQFTYRAFNLTSRLKAQYEKEVSASKAKKKIPTSKNIIVRSEEIKINLQQESVSAINKLSFISELSRRDQQDVEAIARRVAQEVLEDELGDDFDKAVRREMISSFKDKEVESGVADISRDFMRKFYRSLGTASSSPLDKVKV